MPTLLELSNKGIFTRVLRTVAGREGITASRLSDLIRKGEAVIPLNKNRKIKFPCAIGKGLTTKINANLGASTDRHSLNEELKKLKVCVDCGADTVMDLSISSNLKRIRAQILKRCQVPLGTVPIYEIAINAKARHNDFLNFGKTEVLKTLEEQAKQGVDFFTVHSGVTLKSLQGLRRQKRLLGIVSRGGAIIAAWIKRHKQENPFYEYFDEILDIAYRYNITLSLGDGLRPGSIWDATDQAQIAELKILGELTKRARKRNVQVMIEGPGHVPLDQIKKNVELEKKICHNAPFYVLGPLVTDIAPGHDHITSAIGGALAASYGADFLCYVTPAEHLRHPTASDVKEGVIASKIAAHAADIAKNIPGAAIKDRDISLARKHRDWKQQISLSIDPEKAAIFRRSSKPRISDVCTMCGDYCSIKMFDSCGL